MMASDPMKTSGRPLLIMSFVVMALMSLAGQLAYAAPAMNEDVEQRALLVGSSGNQDGSPGAEAALGYWVSGATVVADIEGRQLHTFPDFDHFALSRSLIAGELEGSRHSSDRIVGYVPATSERLFRIRNATNPVVAAGGRKVFFFPTSRRDGYVMSVWVRKSSGVVRRVARFKAAPGLPGIRHGMRAGGAPLDFALDQRGRYMAVAFGLETLRSFDVWVIDTKTKQATRMTRGENSHNPSMSPDGSQVAVRVESPDPCPDPFYGEILVGKIRVLSRVDGKRKTLTEFDCDIFYDTPRWIDNETLVAVRVTKDAEQTYGYDLDIVRIDAASGSISEVITEGNPCCLSVSPSLGKVAYEFSDTEGVAMLDLSTGAVLEFPGETYVPHLADENRL